jgi:hypothetical protein
MTTRANNDVGASEAEESGEASVQEAWPHKWFQLP